MCYASPTLTMWSVPGLPPSWLVLVAAAYLFAVSGCSNIAARMSNAEGERLFEQARYAEAIGQFQRAIEEDPSDADGYYNVAAVYHREGIASGRLADLSQAERYYNLCLDHDPNHRDCYRGLAVLLVQEGHTEEAFRRLRGWCDRNPASSAARLELARLSEEFGDRAAARQHLAEALEIDPTNTVALNAMGHLHEREGNYSQAVTDYRQSLAADRFQQEVAERVAALQSTLGPVPVLEGDSSGTRVVTRDTWPVRY